MGTRSGNKGAWKAAEEWLAQIFGAHRRPLSGNTSGRDDQDGSDTTHPALYLEAKLRSEHSVRKLHDHCRKRAKGRPVVIGLRDKGRPGGLIVVHDSDLPALCVEWLKSQDIANPKGQS